MTIAQLKQQGPIAIQAIGLVKDFGSGDSLVHALRGVDISFARGAFTAIMGPSGSGKSTLMHSLAGLDSCTAGQVLFDGQDITQLKDKELTLLRRRRIGFIFQSFNLLPMFTAEQNILLPLTLAGDKPDRAWFNRLVTALELTDRLTHRPSELSGGQQQRVAIARALITKPDLVFADEPTGNLDSVSSAEVLDFLRRSVKELGQTVIMVTHDAIAASYADRAIVIADGMVVADEPSPRPERMNELLTQTRHRIVQEALPTAAQTGYPAQPGSGVPHMDRLSAGLAPTDSAPVDRRGVQANLPGLANDQTAW